MTGVVLGCVAALVSCAPEDPWQPIQAPENQDWLEVLETNDGFRIRGDSEQTQNMTDFAWINSIHYLDYLDDCRMLSQDKHFLIINGLCTGVPFYETASSKNAFRLDYYRLWPLKRHWSFQSAVEECQARFDHLSYLISPEYEESSITPKQPFLIDFYHLATLRSSCDAQLVSVFVFSPYPQTTMERRNKAWTYARGLVVFNSGGWRQATGEVIIGAKPTLPLTAPLQAKLDRGEYVIRFELSKKSRPYWTAFEYLE